MMQIRNVRQILLFFLQVLINKENYFFCKWILSMGDSW